MTLMDAFAPSAPGWPPGAVPPTARSQEQTAPCKPPMPNRPRLTPPLREAAESASRNKKDATNLPPTQFRMGHVIKKLPEVKMMKSRKVVIAVALAGAALGISAAPALAQTHTPFVVQDNGGALVTQQSLTTGQIVYSGGIAYHVTSAGSNTITLIPRVPASDSGKSMVFSW